LSRSIASLGIGIVGLGFMGRRYARFVNHIEGMHVAGVCDLNQALASEVIAESGGRMYIDPADLAAAEDVDAVVVCTPEDQHFPPAMAAIAAGKPVMIEKPVAHSLDAARAIAIAGAAEGVPILVAHLLRFEPRWVAARQRIDAGAIGDVVSITTRRIGNLLDQSVLRGRTTIPLYYGVHDLDVMHWYAGAKAATISAQMHAGALRAAGYDVDDFYTAMLTFTNGIHGTAELGWHVPANAVASRTSGVSIVGTKGAIRIEQGETGFECWTDAGLDRSLDTTFWLEAYGIAAGALGLEIRHFGDCVRGKREPAIPIDDAIEALRLSLAMEQAAETATIVDLATFG
jgi:predicted dehydrogenase